MMNRNNKPKKHSKLKHTNDRFSYNSPAKFVSTGCCPKQPPNISMHHLQRKRHQIKGEYYITGKQNKYRISNNSQQQFSILQTTDRLKQKRNTYHNLLQVRKSTNHNQNNQNHLKTINHNNKSKLHPRMPITLGSMKNHKTNNLNNHNNKILRTTNNNNQKPKHSNKPQSHTKNSLLIRKQVQKQKTSTFIPEDDVCNLMCTEYLSSGSISQSKVSSTFNNYTHEEFTQFCEESEYHEYHLQNKHKVQQKQVRKNRNTKGLYRSPKILSPLEASSSSYFHHKIYKKTPQQQIAQFQSKINEINTNFQHDSLTYMQNKDFQFIQSKNLNCYLGNQIYLDWKKRAVVVNWMIEVLAEIEGKRQTLANSVNIFDRYLSSTYNIPLDHMQCIAVASISIASKLQDKQLSAYYLSETTMHKYTPEQIMQQEYKIFSTLNFKVNTPTLNSWANRLAIQWDMYLDTVDLRNFELISDNLHLIKFKNCGDNTSYYNYRWLCQYLDFSIMDINTLRYQPRMLSLAFIYLILALRLNVYSKEQVINNFPYSSQFLFEKSIFHDFFTNFLKESFGQQLLDLLPMIQYCSTFVILPLRFDLPQAILDSDDDSTQSYQSICSYQTKNQNTLPSLYKRNRSVI